MPDQPEYILVTRQTGAIGSADINAYASPDVGAAELEEAGRLLSAGASPEMTFDVVPLQPAKWDSI